MPDQSVSQILTAVNSLGLGRHLYAAFLLALRQEFGLLLEHDAVALLVEDSGLIVDGRVVHQLQRHQAVLAGHRNVADAIDLAQVSVDAPEVILLDVVLERMVVALGALDLGAEEDARDARRDRHHLELALFGLARGRRALADVGQDKVGGAVLAILAAGGDQLLDDLVVRLVLGELILQPFLHLGVIESAAEDAGAPEQPVGPVVGPVARILVAG